MSARTIIENIDDFAKRRHGEVKRRMAATPRSDYGHGDRVYTMGGTPVQFISDTIPDREGKPRVIVKGEDGATWSTLRAYITPEMPSRVDALAWLATRCRDFSDFVRSAARRGYDDQQELEHIWSSR